MLLVPLTSDDHEPALIVRTRLLHSEVILAGMTFRMPASSASDPRWGVVIPCARAFEALFDELEREPLDLLLSSPSLQAAAAATATALVAVTTPIAIRLSFSFPRRIQSRIPAMSLNSPDIDYGSFVSAY